MLCRLIIRSAQFLSYTDIEEIRLIRYNLLMGSLETYLYAVDTAGITEDDELYKKALAQVSESRRKKTLKIRDISGRRCSLAAELLTRHAITDLGVPWPGGLETEDGGRPYLKGTAGIHISISHSGSMVICSVSERETGCDIEQIKEGRSGRKIAERFFTEAEQEFAGDDTLKFYRIWTLKESFLKVTGLGLALPLCDFSIEVSDREGGEADISVIQHVDANSYIFREFQDFPGYCCSVCTAGSDICKDVRRVEFRSLIW